MSVSRPRRTLPRCMDPGISCGARSSCRGRVNQHSSARWDCSQARSRGTLSEPAVLKRWWIIDGAYAAQFDGHNHELPEVDPQLGGVRQREPPAADGVERFCELVAFLRQGRLLSDPVVRERDEVGAYPEHVVGIDIVAAPHLIGEGG